MYSPYETFDMTHPSPLPAPGNDASLTPHLVRIVRRAMRRTDDRSPLACAIRGAVAQIDAGGPDWSAYDEESRMQQLARRVSALLTPDFRDPAGRGAHRETVLA